MDTLLKQVETKYERAVRHAATLDNWIKKHPNGGWIPRHQYEDMRNDIAERLTESTNDLMMVYAVYNINKSNKEAPYYAALLDEVDSWTSKFGLDNVDEIKRKIVARHITLNLSYLNIKKSRKSCKKRIKKWNHFSVVNLFLVLFNPIWK